MVPKKPKSYWQQVLDEVLKKDDPDHPKRFTNIYDREQEVKDRRSEMRRARRDKLEEEKAQALAEGKNYMASKQLYLVTVDPAVKPRDDKAGVIPRLDRGISGEKLDPAVKPQDDSAVLGSDGVVLEDGRAASLNDKKKKQKQWIWLTQREVEASQCFILGRTVKETAEQLGLSIRTVEYYTKNLRQKFGVGTKVALVARLEQSDIGRYEVVVSS